MPLWDSFADQIQTLPVAAAIDPVADELVFAGATRSGAQAALLNAVPNSLVWMLQVSGVGVNPQGNTIVGSGRRDGFRSPYALTAMRLHLTITTAYGAGTQPFFDLYNETANISLLDNTTAIGNVLSLPTNSATIATDDPIDVSAVASNSIVGIYCASPASNNLGATWGHLQYHI